MSFPEDCKKSSENQGIELYDTDNSSKGSTSCGDGENTPNSTSKKVLVGSRKRINEASLSVDEVERLQTKRAYNRECASRARQRGKELVAQLEKQVKDLHDDKSELRRTLATMEKRLKQLQRENELLLGRQAISTYEGMMVANMNDNSGIQFPQAQIPFLPVVRSSNLHSAKMTMNGAPYMGKNHYY